jgi:hypothetical protein
MVTCTTIKRHGTSHQRCTAHLGSRPVTFGTGADRASVSRGGLLYATGVNLATRRGRSRMLLAELRPLRAGRYTLTLRARRGRAWRLTRQTIVID